MHLLMQFLRPVFIQLTKTVRPYPCDTSSLLPVVYMKVKALSTTSTFCTQQDFIQQSDVELKEYKHPSLAHTVPLLSQDPKYLT